MNPVILHDAPTRILLVDDLEDNLVALEALLRRDDLEILQASGGREALELLLSHDVALALVDVQMPEMDGFELAELMRGSERTRHIPVIFVTAGVRDHQRVFQGYDAGAVDFIFKPVEPHALRNKVNTFVQLDRQRRQLGAQLDRERKAQEERERLMKEMQETLRFNELFMAILGHDLRNPLGAIRTTASLLQKQSADASIHRSAERLKSLSDRMARMISDLLDLARARLGGGIPVQPKDMDALTLTRRTVEELSLVFADRRIQVESQGNTDGHWDEDRLAQVLSNLITNAAQHGVAQEGVRVGVDGRDRDTLLLTVGNGGTVSPDLIPRMFDPFRSGREEGAKNQGLGLGLFIVQQIVDAHGGSVAVTSANGQTVFSVWLPRWKKTAALAASLAKSP